MREVEELVGDMLRNGQKCLILSSTVVLESFSILVKELCAKGMVLEAERIFEDMCNRCTVVNVDSYRSVLEKRVLDISSDPSSNRQCSHG
ncbi:hypothetical protein GBA52_028395 [Prunus armeniaca]|nr:hypothetical protein GBA52_028395 [Prunus armeniaca]